MLLKYWDEAFIAATYLINRSPTKTLDFSSNHETLFRKNPTMLASGPLGVPTDPISGPATHISFNSAPNNEYSWVIAIFTRGLSALIFLVVVFTYPVMWY
jgi:hypothetical protein